ncbi:MAG: bifunctional diaminohydroxyphosphoribosylaminopyrimidine deaminase/5-amino-6-(5-phosphoribosylamino)uracil reductase RibD [Muribaculum sp.]|nr:bifunctional diaminohydroxyphosphoribosylaminopyrimidine deaminase/5-amino-6-(5-phosphoribosylamino)uracil reductase RibD [Muribaculum sp.]
MNNPNKDSYYMRRALQLAALGSHHVSPNPLVGAVIVARDRIIGEGWHRQFGGPHAEVNAIMAVSDEDLLLLPEATIYVTLEPCSHYGKTPPCAELIINRKLKRVVIGAPDPNPLVSGRGVDMIRRAGIEVSEGVLLEECLDINRRFMTAQILQRPWIQLKWAQAADGTMASDDGSPRLMVSNPVSSVWMHRERSMADAILVGVDTVIKDNPALSCRLWPARDNIAITFDSPRIPAEAAILKSNHILIPRRLSLPDFVAELKKKHNIGALMVEGGPKTLASFIDAGLFDEARVEIAPRLRPAGGMKAPRIPQGIPLVKTETAGTNLIMTYRRDLPPLPHLQR